MIRLRKIRRAVVLRVTEDLLGRPLLADDALVEEAHLGGDLAGEAHLVGGEQHRHALGSASSRTMFSTSETSSGSSAEVISSSSSRRGCMARARHDGHPLLLAAREPVGVLVGLLVEADARQQGVGAVVGLLAGSRAPCGGRG